MTESTIACRLCFDIGRIQLRLTPTPLANSFPDHPDADAERYPLDVMECLKCGHVQLAHKAPVSWHDYKYVTPEAMRPHFASAAKQLRLMMPDAAKVLEIGCNSGMYLEELHKVGFEPIGVDPALPAGMTGIAAPFTTALARTLKGQEIVVANNVLAHVDDWFETMWAIDSVLDDDGALVFEVQYLPEMVKRGAFDLIYHEHRDYHRLGPLAKALKRFRLVITHVEFLPVHGGSIRVYCQRPGIGIGPPNEEIDWRAFAKRIEDEKRLLLAELDTITAPIVAFGAPAKATTLIHHFGLADRIAYCVDDTPQKQGRYLPGTNIKIYSTQTLRDDPTAVILLMAWNYETLIKSQYPDREFIVPFTHSRQEVLR